MIVLGNPLIRYQNAPTSILIVFNLHDHRNGGEDYVPKQCTIEQDDGYSAQ